MNVFIAVIILAAAAFNFDDYLGMRYAWEALAISRHGTADVSMYTWHIDDVWVGGNLLPTVAPALPFLEAAITRACDFALNSVGLPLPSDSARPYQLVWWLTITAPSTGFIALAGYRLARRRMLSVRRAKVNALLLVLATPVVGLSQGLRQTVPLIALTMACLLIIDDKHEEAERGSRALVLGLVGGCAFLVDNQGALTIAAACAALLISGRLKQSLAAGAVGACALPIQLAFNSWSTGSWMTFAPIEWFRDRAPEEPSIAARFIELTVSADAGFFVWIPVTIALAFSTGRPLRAPHMRSPQSTFVITLAVLWLAMHGLWQRASHDASLGPRYSLIWLIPALALTDVTRTRLLTALSFCGVVMNSAGALLGPTAISLDFWEAPWIVALHGPFVQWTTILFPPQGSISNTGLVAILTPTPIGAAASILVVLCSAAASWWVLGPHAESQDIENERPAQRLAEL